MSIRVCLDEETSIICIEASGQLLRREFGWAAIRVEELLRVGTVVGLLVDTTGVLRQNSPALSSEMISEFAAVLDPALPIAVATPEDWTEAYYRQVMAGIDDPMPRTGLFSDVAPARAWLRAAVTADDSA